MTHKEAIVKALVWRFLVAIPVTFIVFYLFTGEVKSATGVSLVFNAIQTLLHYVFEYTWPRLYHVEETTHNKAG